MVGEVLDYGQAGWLSVLISVSLIAESLPYLLMCN